MPTTTVLLPLLILFSFLSSTSTLHHRRILHQPFLPQGSIPPTQPPTPSPPSPPKYPFTFATPDNSTFFPSDPSPPPPPAPVSFASFPANISSLTVPRPSKPNSSSSSKLIAAAVAAVIAAIAVVSLAVFLHLRSRTRTHGSSSFNQSKTQRSDNSSTVSFNQTPDIHHIPKLQRPSQSSSEFLYLGTLVNSHAPGGGTAFNGSSTSTTNYTNAANSRKMDSPELRPLPPLNMQQGFRQNFRNNADVVSSKDDESEEFYSPKGSITGRESSIGTGSASRRGFAAIEVENFNGSTSNSSSTYSSSVPGSGSPVRSESSSLSPANNMSPRSSMPKSPDLIEIQTIAALPPHMPPQQETRGPLSQESASPSPPSSSSPERYSRRSEESSPRISNVSDQNVESSVRNSSLVQHNSTVIATPSEVRDLVFPESAPPMPLSSLSPESHSKRSEESSPRISNTSDQSMESPVRISNPVQHNITVVPTPWAIRGLAFLESASPLPRSSLSPEGHSKRSEESSTRISNASDRNMESPVQISSPVQHNTTVIPTTSAIRGLMLPESSMTWSSLSPERYAKSKESSPRISNASDQNVESPVRISSPVQHSTTVIPTPSAIRGLMLPESAMTPSSLSPERYANSKESSPRISDASDQNVESPVRISSPVQHSITVIPTTSATQGLVIPESTMTPSSLSPERYWRSKESSPRISNASDQNVESQVRISSPVHHNSTAIPTQSEMQGLVFHESALAVPPSALLPEKYSSRSEESSPRISNASDQNIESPVRISSAIPTLPEMQGLLFQESASPLPPIALPRENFWSRSEESSPRNSNVSDQNVESPLTISSPIQDHSTVTPTPPEMQILAFQESASPLPPSASSAEKYWSRSEESSPRNSNFSEQNVESLVQTSSPVQHNSTVIPTLPEMQSLAFQESASPLPQTALSPEKHWSISEESSSRNSNVLDQNVESLVRISGPVQHSATAIPTPSVMQTLEFQESASTLPLSALSPERYSRRSEESLPRISNVSDESVESEVRSSSPGQHKSPLSVSSLSPERYSRRGEESSQRISNDSVENVESPMRISSPVQHKSPVFPPPPVTSQPLPPPRVSVPPPPPPPPLLSKVWESPRTPNPPAKKPVGEPPALIAPLRPIAFEGPSLVSPIELPSIDSQAVKNDGDKESPTKETEYSSEDMESTPKPKLKPLHWDKVRASSDREMVWDQLKCSSFKVNEEMIETLFVVNDPKPNPREATRWQVLPSPGQENGNRILDPKKAQNIAILLRALHVTVDEVCEGLLEGNADILGTELLESLLKMAPMKEEERKLKECKDDSPIKLGAAERFLKAVIDIPYAFERVDAMLYVSNFESEIEYLKKSFSTLEAACEELRTSRMFLKLLEAVLKTGNRMNVGTNRGDAHAFKLDTLLKLVDVKGADGKTTLLHFVVQEIIRSEGARLSGGSPYENYSSINDDAKCRKLGLQVVSALSSELSNVKKAAVMDAEVLSSEVSKLSKGIGNVREIVRLNEMMPLEESGSHKFSDNMNSFMKMAEEEIIRIQAQESVALSLVKEITEYFHGDSAKEEAHPFRIFMVVRDFLTILDRVCKEVGMINERTIVSSAHKFPVPVNPMLQQVSGGFHKRQYTSSDDESLPLNI